MGVWIEIKIRTPLTDLTNVTPCMGVWIEICWLTKNGKIVPVTPCMGVWIEILKQLNDEMKNGSLPVWECGLK